MKSAYLKVWLLFACFLISASAWAQTKKISGTVVNDEGNPLAGVSVTIKGKKGGTQTNGEGQYSIANGEGQYSIDASEKDVLLFSYSGFETHSQTVGVSSTIDLSLKSVVAKIDEVVVMGYGTAKRSKLTSSVAIQNLLHL